MKTFEKTISFVRDFNSFPKLVFDLWHGNYRGNDGADWIIGQMNGLCNATRLMGEELADEVEEICPDVSQVQRYYDLWCGILEKADTFLAQSPEDDEILDATQWACRLGDDDKGCSVVALINRMTRNLDDVMEGKRWLEATYSLSPHDNEQDLREQTVGGYDTPVTEEDLKWDFDTSGLTLHSAQMTMPLGKLHTFLINEGVIPADVPQEYFVRCVRYANFGTLYVNSEKKVKLHRTFNEIRRKYYPKDEAYMSDLIRSVGRNPEDKKDRVFMSKGAIVDDYMEKLKEIL